MSNRTDDAEGDNPASWLDDGEKYALIGLGVKVVKIPFRQVSANLWVSAGVPFNLPPDWRNWIGSIRVSEVENFNCFLISKTRSATPDILDAENQSLMEGVWRFYASLLLASTFAPSHDPVLVTGSRRDGEIGIRQLQNFDCPIPGIIHRYPEILPKDIELAARLAGNLGAQAATALDGGSWRFNRTLHLYTEARAISDILDRIHQYARCIDGLILPRPGETTRQFKSRTELFIGPRHHELMGQIYDVRSAVEHLHENRYLESFDRETRLDLVRKEAIIEHVARSALARIVGDMDLWPHFANTTALARFWALDQADRRRLWGDPIDPMKAIAEFDRKNIHDGLLGAH